jgi:drug/metabolite transporter superfamily protein YnfA
MTATAVARSLALFALAGMMEIGGGYLVWLWLRESRAVWLGALGASRSASNRPSSLS